MKRGLWFVAGAGAGIYASWKARRVADSLSPDGLRDRVRAAAAAVEVAKQEANAARTETVNRLTGGSSAHLAESELSGPPHQSRIEELH